MRWTQVLREGVRPYVMANTAIESSRGWALVSARFGVREGGPAWLEIEAVPGGGAAFAFTGAKQVPTSGAPSYAFSLNGEEPVIVERLSRESGSVWRQPVTLATGFNRLVIHGALDTGVAFAVRVLGPDGRVYPGLGHANPQAPLEEMPLGAPVDVAPPSEPLRTTESWLAGHPGLAHSADLLALAGVLAFVDERQAEGLARLRAALELDPSRIGLRALLARLTQDTPYLPEVWRRNRARNLSEQVHAERPDFLSVGLDLARVLSDEDREEEAIERLLVLTELHPGQSRSLLDLQSVYLKLDMHVAAERALLDAYERTPDNATVLDRLARHHKASGRIRAWAETAERAMQLYSLAVGLDDAGHMRLTHARFLASIERMQLAFAETEALVHAFPDWEQPHLLLADLYHRSDDRENELHHLRAALERRPSMREARDRVYELTGEERTESFFARFKLDADAIREGWDDSGSEDSVVKLIDHQIVMVYEDGAAERLTQDVYQARDLAGCEALGEYGVSGEAIEIATVKADGRVFEPVQIGRSYVMPSLEPGDFVVETSRQFQHESPNGVARMGSWWFASTQQPFEISRYVISVPPSLELRMEARNGAREIERITGDDATIYVFEVHSQPRILPQPGAPPDDWFVPWVEFGMDSDEDTILAQLAAAVLWPTRVTPEIREAAAQALAEAGDPAGDEARARALHRFTNDTLDQRGGYDATQSLLAREGNAVWLYSALLKAADVPHEIVWSRNVAPDADLEPDAPFIEPGYWSRKLLVLVQPRDGEPAWCDMDIKTMPYGEMMGDAAGAPAVAVPSMRKIALPELPIEEQPSVHIAMRLALEPDGSAELEGSADIKAGYGFIAKEAIRDIPEAYRSYAINAAVSQLLPGTSVTGFELPGLEV
ncbi:MAG: tetratricopeptide repeat protein, partial [Planctomycetota bacterium]